MPQITQKLTAMSMLELISNDDDDEDDSEFADNTRVRSTFVTKTSCRRFSFAVSARMQIPNDQIIISPN